MALIKIILDKPKNSAQQIVTKLVGNQKISLYIT